MTIMYQAINTKFLPATNVRGSRVKAIAEAGSVTLSWDHALNAEDNHVRAAEELARKFGWQGNWRGGALPKSSGYAFVCGHRDDAPAFTIKG